MSLRWALALSLVWLACGPSPVRGARELGEIASRRFRETLAPPHAVSNRAADEPQR